MPLICMLCRRDHGDRGGDMTRATAFGNRTISGQRREAGMTGGAASAEDDSTDSLEMAAMAKVWAHPEDLHKYPVGLLHPTPPLDCACNATCS